MSNVVVYGGAGALGRHLVSKFAANNWVSAKMSEVPCSFYFLNIPRLDQTVTSIDLVKNDSAKHNVLLNIDASLEEQAKEALEGVSQALGSEKAAAVLCVAGGWAGGNAKSTGT